MEIKLKPEALRVNMGMDQSTFAEKLGLSVRVYQKRLNHETEWKINEIIKMAEIGKVSIDQIDY